MCERVGFLEGATGGGVGESKFAWKRLVVVVMCERVGLLVKRLMVVVCM